MTEEIKEEVGTEVQSEPTTPSVADLQAEIERLKAEVGQTDKLKKSISEACADAAEWKRKYRATLDESERAKQEQAEKVSDIRGEIKEIGFGNQIRSYVMQPYTLVKDHRTNVESGNVASVLDGNIDLFMNAYLKGQNKEET